VILSNNYYQSFGQRLSLLFLQYWNHMGHATIVAGSTMSAINKGACLFFFMYLLCMFFVFTLKKNYFHSQPNISYNIVNSNYLLDFCTWVSTDYGYLDKCVFFLAWKYIFKFSLLLIFVCKSFISEFSSLFLLFQNSLSEIFSTSPFSRSKIIII